MENSVRKVTVFLGSPGDVDAERKIAEETVQDLNVGFASSRNIVIELQRWETHVWPGFGVDAQDVINSQIGSYDIFVGVFWNRFGTPTLRAGSGSAEEFERAYASWQQHKRPALMLYFRRSPANLSTLEEVDQKRRLIEFKEILRRRGALFREYDTPDDFRRMLSVHLLLQITALEKSAEVTELNRRVDSQQERIDQQEEKLRHQRHLIDQLVTYSMAEYIYTHLRSIYRGQHGQEPHEYLYRKNPAMERDIRFLRDHNYIELIQIGSLRDGTDLVKAVKLTAVGNFCVELREGMHLP